MDRPEAVVRLLPLHQGGALSVKVDALLFGFPRLPALRERVVVEPPARLQGFLQFLGLRTVWPQLVDVGAVHLFYGLTSSEGYIPGCALSRLRGSQSVASS